MVKTNPKKVHDATLTIRVKRELIDRAREGAHKQGMSLSEAVRQFLRELGAGRDIAAEVAAGGEILALIRELFDSPTQIRMGSAQETEDWQRRWNKARERDKGDADTDT